MSRTPVVTNAELAALAERAMDLSADLRSTAEAIRKHIGYDADVAAPASYARSFAGLSHTASDLAAAMLTVLANNEDRLIIEATLRERAS